MKNSFCALILILNFPAFVMAGGPIGKTVAGKVIPKAAETAAGRTMVLSTTRALEAAAGGAAGASAYGAAVNPEVDRAMESILINKAKLAGTVSVKPAANANSNTGSAKDLLKSVTKAAYMNLVTWRLQNSEGKAIAYLKFIRNNDELENLQKLAAIKMPEFEHIELTIYRLMSTSLEDVPPPVVQEILGFYQNYYQRNGKPVPQDVVITGAVDMSGYVGVDEYVKMTITQNQWRELSEVFKILNENGVVHGDVLSNMALRPGKKLGVTIIDFDRKPYFEGANDKMQLGFIEKYLVE